MLLLPRDKRRSMYALYAFLRHSDDLTDSELPLEQRRAALDQWRHNLDAALAGDSKHPILPALIDTVERHAIPVQYLVDVLEGVAMDLEDRVYATFADLEPYCYRVASAVGLACIHIWGFHGDDALDSARDCGIAFQLTNILRDLKEDADRGRLYLPIEDLRRFDYPADGFVRREINDAFHRLLDFEIERAESFYERARPLHDRVHPDGRHMLRAMVGTYHAILDEIKRRPGNVLREHVRLSRWRKAWITATSLWD
jgi:phytoene synthase